MIPKYVVAHREAILKAWRAEILSAYPEEGAKQLAKGGDPFGNPVGVAIQEETGPLLDSVAEGSDHEIWKASLDRLIRPRAIQEMPPSEAVAFVYRLKDIIRSALETDDAFDDPQELARFSERVEEMGLVAFDVYMKCREDVFSIRLKEIRNRSLKAFERLNEWKLTRDSSTGSDGD